jgi:hypothetical protein
VADFIPKDNDDFKTWATNLRDKLDTFGAAIGLTAAQITALKAVLQAGIDRANAITAARTALAGAVANMDTYRRTDLAESGLVRTTLRQVKASGLVTPAIAGEMDIVGTAPAFDEGAYKAAITAETRAGFVRISFKKRGVDGLNIYVRLKGQTTWKKLSFDSNSPYDDYTELAVAGTAEVREYRAIGVIDDLEIGQPSDIVSVTFGG